MIVLQVLGWILLGLLGLLVFVLFMPLRAEARGALSVEEASGMVRADWGWVLVRFVLGVDQPAQLRVLGVPVPLRGRAKEEDAEEDEKKPKKPRKKRRFSPRGFLAHRRHWVRSGRRLLRAFRLDGALWGTIPAGDPAGAWWVPLALDALRAHRGRVIVDLRTDFLGDDLAVEGWIRGRFWPPRLVAAAVLVLLQPKTWRAIRAAT